MRTAWLFYINSRNNLNLSHACKHVAICVLVDGKCDLGECVVGWLAAWLASTFPYSIGSGVDCRSTSIIKKCVPVETGALRANIAPGSLRFRCAAPLSPRWMEAEDWRLETAGDASCFVWLFAVAALSDQETNYLDPCTWAQPTFILRSHSQIPCRPASRLLLQHAGRITRTPFRGL